MDLRDSKSLPRSVRRWLSPPRAGAGSEQTPKASGVENPEGRQGRKDEGATQSSHPMGALRLPISQDVPLIWGSGAQDGMGYGWGGGAPQLPHS